MALLDILIMNCNLWMQTRAAAISSMKMVDLAGKDGIASEYSPGVFIQVYFFLCILFIFRVSLVG